MKPNLFIGWRRFAVICALAAFSPALLGAGPQREGVEDPDLDTPHGPAISARDAWFLRQRRTASGEPAATLRHRALEQKAKSIRALQPMAAGKAAQSHLQLFSAGTGPAWQALGPSPIISDPRGFQSYGNVAGRVTAVAVDQSDGSGNTVYIGSAYGGVWKSTNAAAATPGSVIWQALIDDQATLSVGAVAVSPDGNTVLVGTGEPNNSGDSYYGLGMLRSTSRGAPETWTLITTANGGAESFQGLGFSKIAFNTNSPGDVVAAVAHSSATEGLGNSGNNVVGLYFSLDGGASWDLANVMDGGTRVSAGSVTDVVFDQNNGVFYAAYRAHGIYQSSDGGQNWTRVAKQPDAASLTLATCPTIINSNSLQSCPLYRGALAFNPATNELFAFLIGISQSGEVNNHIWRTTNGGATAWTQIVDTDITSCGDQAGCGVNQGTYDLYLSAVPDGARTDLYAGLVNLYKGTAGGAPSNMTHVYGCNPVHFHPDFHAQDFSRTNPKLIYFGNDGGVYRTLNGYGFTGTANTCNVGKVIDSLNNNIGSLTQFYSFSQHPTNSSIILGGTQDNGSPATAAAGPGATWPNVNLGDGMFNEIDPSGSVLFTSNNDVSVQRCVASVNDPICEFLNFNVLVNANPDLSPINFPDHGDFVTPYILDPANSGRIIIGTCRVWRGSSSSQGNWSAGSFANALSNHLNAGNGGANAACSAGEDFYVSALAAGGPATGAGSQVIYAGMGSGVDSNGNPTGGNIWVTTNAAGGAGTWVDRTDGINPNHFDVSSIAVDPNDASGNTAYITIMGFTGSSGGHVFKTTNAGASWSDVSGNLPDAPVDSIVLDPSNPNALFVGSDVGVFRSTDDGATWIAIGQSFPNVVANHLRIFDSGGTLLLRASTHGRGVWQLPLNYNLIVNSLLVTVFPGQTGNFGGTVFGAYAGDVGLSCQPGTTALPDTCTPTPASLIPTANFNVSASAAAPQDYSFNIRASGLNVQNQPVTLRVIDYSMSTPASIVAYPNAPASTTVTLSALGQFNQSISLACAGAPPNAGCTVSPAIVQPSPGNPVTATVTVNATDFSPTGNYNITITASTAGAPADKTVNFTMALEDFAISAAPSEQVIFPGQSVVFNGTMTPLNGYALAVVPSCANGTTTPPSACSVMPASVNSASPTFSITAGTQSGSTPQDYLFNVAGKGGDPAGNIRQQALRLRVVDFAMSAASPASVSMPPSEISQPVNVQLIPLGSFDQPVTLSCAGLPAGTTCSFNGVSAPAVITPSGSPRPVAVTVITSSSTPAGNSTVTISAATAGRPNGAVTQPFMLTVTAATGSTDLSVADGAVQPPTKVDPVGQPLAPPMTFTVTNNGSAVTNANLYVNFAEPVFVDPSTDASCTGAGTITAAISCTIGSMQATDSHSISVVVVPGFTRTVNASAVVNSELGDSDLSNNTAAIIRNVRPRPWTRVPAKLP